MTEASWYIYTLIYPFTGSGGVVKSLIKTYFDGVYFYLHWHFVPIDSCIGFYLYADSMSKDLFSVECFRQRPGRLGFNPRLSHA